MTHRIMTSEQMAIVKLAQLLAHLAVELQNPDDDDRRNSLEAIIVAAEAVEEELSGNQTAG